MNKKLKTKWVKALRSGKYEQGSFALKAEDNSFCCLGVLCDVYGCEWTGAYVKLKGTKEKQRSYFNDEGLKKVGLTNDQQCKLMHFNDQKRWSFKKIASYIERYV